ncbi:phosphate ABC transporter permease PstA [Lusitaniella coriacea]|uniref:phosphate ABC transporter permease PstA n=1 Tax=Lusitaniella coriacea TaxID=1983105 RepID=UPI003CFAAC95
MTSEQSSFSFNPSRLKRDPKSPRTLLGLIMTAIAGLFTLLAIIPLGFVLYYILIKGFSSINLQSFTQLPPPPMVENQGGFGNALLGTMIMVGIATLISVPIGVMTAIYLSEFSAGSKVAEWVRFATNVLSGVPSIIIGVFAYGILVINPIPWFYRGYSAWAGGFALALLMLPTIIRATEEALKLVPREVRWASVGVGANDYQTVLQVVLPAAIPAIVTGVTLGVARAAGETAPLLFTALNTQFWPNWDEWLFEPTASLSVLVYNFATVPFENQNEIAFAAALVLVLFVLVTNIVARVVTSRETY